MSTASVVFRAGLCSDRAEVESDCAHDVFTGSKFPVFARDSGMLADSQSVATGACSGEQAVEF